MTMRENPKTGEKVSLLGFGCMRWPSLDGRTAREGVGEIDQNAVNELVDRAIAGGVNYFDTSSRVLPRQERARHGNSPLPPPGAKNISSRQSSPILRPPRGAGRRR